MIKRITATLITLCCVAIAILGVASASRDIGQISYEQINGRSTRTLPDARAKRYYSRQKAEINTGDFSLDSVSSVGNDELENKNNGRAISTTYYVSWRVLDDGALVTEYKSVHDNYRQLNPYNSTVGDGDNFRLRIHNPNSFVLTINGYWCPDCKSTD